MLMDLAQPLKEGDTVPITLTFEDKAGAKQAVVVSAPCGRWASRAVANFPLTGAGQPCSIGLTT